MFWGVIRPRHCPALESQTYTTFFFNFIFIPPPGLIGGAEAERFGPGDALCGAAEGGAPALLASPRFVNPIGPQRALGVRGDHDERGKKRGQERKKNEADLKNSRQMSVYVGCVRSRRNTGAGCASVDSRLGESGRITRRGLTQRRGGK